MDFVTVHEAHHWHQVLGVPCNATISEIKSTYQKLTLSRQHEFSQKNDSEKFIEITQAYHALINIPQTTISSSHDLLNRSTDISKPSSTASVVPGIRPKFHRSVSSFGRIFTFPKVGYSPRSPQATFRTASSLSDDISSTSSSLYLPETTSLTSPSSENASFRCSLSDYVVVPSQKLPPAASAPMAKTNPTFPLVPEIQRPICVSDDIKTQWHSQPHSPGSSTLSYNPPFSSLGSGASKQWCYSLTLSLEELFLGKYFRFRITRCLLSGATRRVVIGLDIPPGCRPGTRIHCRGMGHERKDGSYQDIVFIISTPPHKAYSWIGDDLVMNVRIPWVDRLKRAGARLCFNGIAGESLQSVVDYPRDKLLKGLIVIYGAGMPILRDGEIVGRGDMVVRWEIVKPVPESSRWKFLRSIFQFKK